MTDKYILLLYEYELYMLNWETGSNCFFVVFELYGWNYLVFQFSRCCVIFLGRINVIMDIGKKRGLFYDRGSYSWIVWKHCCMGICEECRKSSKKCVCVSATLCFMSRGPPWEMAPLALIPNAPVCEKYGETEKEKRGHTEGEFSMGEEGMQWEIWVWEGL